MSGRLLSGNPSGVYSSNSSCQEPGTKPAHQLRKCNWARFGAPGDFAQAYVIAHEVGHHVQKQTGAFQKMEAARARSQSEQNRISVRMELQADCYAGVWGHHAGTMNQLDPGDIAEALNAATAIGDDRLQKETQGRVAPESFTHGTSEQRVRWFKRGLDSGNPKDCDSTNSV